MAPRPRPLDKSEVLKEAPNHPSLSKLAGALGWKPGSFIARLKAEGWTQEVRGLLSTAEAVPLPGEEVSEVELLTQRNEELEKALRIKRKEDVFEQRILDALSLAVSRRKPEYSPRAIPKSQRASEQHEMVLLWSDPHAGEVVSYDETNGINEYDWDTMWRRHDKLRDGVFSYLDNRPYPVKRLHVAALGDMVGGDIHEELAETNEFPPAEVAVQYGMDGAAFLGKLGKPFERVDFVGVIGNHGRLRKKPSAKKAYNNWDRVAYRVMSLALEDDKRFSFEIPKATMWPFKVARNFRILAWHGDGVRSTMPGVPWGGVQRRAAALQHQYTQVNQPIDLFAVGHFHSANLVQGSAGWVAMNGSIKGPDEYSLKAFGGGSPAQQVLLTWHPKHGLTDWSVIDLTPPVPRHLTLVKDAA